MEIKIGDTIITKVDKNINWGDDKILFQKEHLVWCVKFTMKAPF